MVLTFSYFMSFLNNEIMKPPKPPKRFSGNSEGCFMFTNLHSSVSHLIDCFKALRPTFNLHSLAFRSDGMGGAMGGHLGEWGNTRGIPSLRA